MEDDGRSGGEVAAEPGGDAVRLVFTLTQEDTVQAYTLHYVSQLWTRATLVCAGVSLLIVAAFAFALLHGDPVGMAVVLSMAALGGVLVPLAMLRWRVPALARRIYGQQRDLQRAVTLDADAAGLRISTETGGSATPWTDFLRWRDNDRVVLLYRSDAIYNFIPVRVLGRERRDAVRALWSAARGEAR